MKKFNLEQIQIQSTTFLAIHPQKKNNIYAFLPPFIFSSFVVVVGFSSIFPIFLRRHIKIMMFIYDIIKTYTETS
jgi:hypothetical protein